MATIGEFLRSEQLDEIYQAVQNKPATKVPEVDTSLETLLNEIRESKKPVMVRKPIRHTDGRSHNKEWPRHK